MGDIEVDDPALGLRDYGGRVDRSPGPSREVDVSDLTIAVGEQGEGQLTERGVVGVERTSVDSGRLHDPLDGLEDRPTGRLRPDVDRSAVRGARCRSAPPKPCGPSRRRRSGARALRARTPEQVGADETDDDADHRGDPEDRPA